MGLNLYTLQQSVGAVEQVRRYTVTEEKVESPHHCGERKGEPPAPDWKLSGAKILTRFRNLEIRPGLLPTCEWMAIISTKKFSKVRMLREAETERTEKFLSVTHT
ncbi:hypothetical protein RUM44_000846 [Polyplax serrata]|uniref:Uncharacterized protein n=1 Tax=Polyplax serrata TaxID=468196 RepID=A0ABR1B969_POLSC